MDPRWQAEPWASQPNGPVTLRRDRRKLHENSTSQPTRWLNPGRDYGSVSDRDRQPFPGATMGLLLASIHCYLGPCRGAAL